MDTSTASAAKKIIFSGIQPSGNLTLGNYLGALKNWVALQDEYDCLYCVVDMHSITQRQDPATLRRKSLELLAQYIAAGIEPEKNIMFMQSHVSAHAELAWVLNCYTMFGELSRMTQFKDKSQKSPENINGGLFTYPVLMAADILLYQTDLVPVGDDQRQHVEITRDIAERFNGVHGETFRIPSAYIPKVGARIMSLVEPTRKMSKSEENENASIPLLDTPDAIVRKIKRAVTDSEAVVRYAPGKDGVNNLMTIYSVCTGKSMEDIENEFAGRGYGDFKAAVAESVVETLRPVRENALRLLGDKAYLESIYTDGAERAAKRARRTLDRVYRKIGFVRAGR